MIDHDWDSASMQIGHREGGVPHKEGCVLHKEGCVLHKVNYMKPILISFHCLLLYYFIYVFVYVL